MRKPGIWAKVFVIPNRIPSKSPPWKVGKINGRQLWSWQQPTTPISIMTWKMTAMLMKNDDFHQFGVGEVEAASDAELVDRETKG